MRSLFHLIDGDALVVVLLLPWMVPEVLVTWEIFAVQHRLSLISNVNSQSVVPDIRWDRSEEETRWPHSILDGLVNSSNLIALREDAQVGERSRSLLLLLLLLSWMIWYMRSHLGMFRLLTRWTTVWSRVRSLSVSIRYLNQKEKRKKKEREQFSRNQIKSNWATTWSHPKFSNWLNWIHASSSWKVISFGNITETNSDQKLDNFLLKQRSICLPSTCFQHSSAFLRMWSSRRGTLRAQIQSLTSISWINLARVSTAGDQVEQIDAPTSSRLLRGQLIIVRKSIRGLQSKMKHSNFQDGLKQFDWKKKKKKKKKIKGNLTSLVFFGSEPVRRTHR